MSKITVSIQVGKYPDHRHDRVFCMNIDDIQRQAFEPLDFPSASSGIFCTPSDVVRRVVKERLITSQEISKAIMALMRMKDTFDGFIPVDPLTGFSKEV